MDEMADAEVHPMLPVHSEEHLSQLRSLDKDPTSRKVFARRQVCQIPGERFRIRFDG